MRRLALLTTIISAMFVPAASAQEPVRYRDEVYAEEQIVRTADIDYGAATNYAGELEILKLDLYEPDGDTAVRRPAIVFVHGGYFKRGDKYDESYRGGPMLLARAGYVVASINYRLNPNLPEGLGPMVMEQRMDEYIDAFFDAQHDAQAAIRFLRANADRYRIDPALIGISGHSAGGITATQVAFNSEDPGDSGNPGYSSAVIAAASHAGGGLVNKTLYADGGDAPIAFMHALDDRVVPYIGALAGCEAAVMYLNACELYTRLQGGHAQFGYEYDRAFFYRWMFDRPATQQPVSFTLVTS